MTTTSDDASLLDLIVYHGAQDAPSVDVAFDNERADLVADALDYKGYVEVRVDSSSFEFGTTGLLDVIVDDRAFLTTQKERSSGKEERVTSSGLVASASLLM